MPTKQYNREIATFIPVDTIFVLSMKQFSKIWEHISIGLKFLPFRFLGDAVLIDAPVTIELVESRPVTSFQLSDDRYDCAHITDSWRALP